MPNAYATRISASTFLLMNPLSIFLNLDLSDLDCPSIEIGGQQVTDSNRPDTECHG